MSSQMYKHKNMTRNKNTLKYIQKKKQKHALKINSNTLKTKHDMK